MQTHTLKLEVSRRESLVDLLVHGTYLLALIQCAVQILNHGGIQLGG